MELGVLKASVNWVLVDTIDHNIKQVSIHIYRVILNRHMNQVPVGIGKGLGEEPHSSKTTVSNTYIPLTVHWYTTNTWQICCQLLIQNNCVGVHGVLTDGGNWHSTKLHDMVTDSQLTSWLKVSLNALLTDALSTCNLNRLNTYKYTFTALNKLF